MGHEHADRLYLETASCQVKTHEHQDKQPAWHRTSVRPSASSISVPTQRRMVPCNQDGRRCPATVPIQMHTCTHNASNALPATHPARCTHCTLRFPVAVFDALPRSATKLQKYDALEEQKSARPTTGPKALTTMTFKEFASSHGLWPDVDNNAYIARFRDDDEGKRKRKHKHQPEAGPARTRARLMGATLQYVGENGGTIKGLRSC